MKNKIKIGVIGAGRIGKLHAENLVKFAASADVIAISDVMLNDELTAWAKELGIPKITNDSSNIINDPEIDAVVICSSTPTHVDLIIQAAAAGKDILCEKPIDVDVDRVHLALDAVKKANVKLQIGFVRRFDHNHGKVQEVVASGELGKPFIVKITTRDTTPPPFEYAKVSGGLFMDMMIHDLDMARFLSGSEVEEVSAYGGVMMDQRWADIDDVDIATVMLKMKNGVLCVIDNCRKSGYGYDQRSEVQCENGCVQIYNDYENTAHIMNNNGVSREKPLHFFIERFQKAYLDELLSFIDDIKNDRKPSVGAIDGLMSVLIAKACKKSLDEGHSVKLELSAKDKEVLGI